MTAEGTTPDSTGVQLIDEMAQYFADPLGFVLACFPWGEPGSELEHYTGPDNWQRRQLEEIGQQVRDRAFDGFHLVAPILRAVASGHGIGKSALTAFIVLWLLSTRPQAQGTVTANTYIQLETKTWAAIQKWHKLCLTGPWFVCTTQRLYHKDAKESWFCAPATCKEENSEAFAGQHAATSSSFYVFDEASAVPNKIFEVAEGRHAKARPSDPRRRGRALSVLRAAGGAAPTRRAARPRAAVRQLRIDGQWRVDEMMMTDEERRLVLDLLLRIKQSVIEAHAEHVRDDFARRLDALALT